MINSILSNIIGLALLIVGAAAWERYNDRNGDLNKQEDIYYRSALCILAALINTLLNNPFCDDWRRTIAFLILSLNVSVAGFFLIFDYWINYTLIKRGVIETSGAHWFSYLRSGGFDAWQPWRNLSPKTRFIIRASYFVLALTAYFIWRS